jgi:hypothetical protein
MKYESAREATWPGLLAAEGECPLMTKATGSVGLPNMAAVRDR